MVKVNQVSICPQSDCGFELPTPAPDTCPNCGHRLKKPKNPYFATPDYLTFQFDDYREKYDEDYRDETAKPLSPADKKTYEEVQKNFTKWARECPTEDKLASLSDAHLVMRNLIHAAIDGEDLKRLVAIGRQIGKLADSIDDFIKCGGALYERETGPIQANDGNDGLSATATGRSGDSA